MSVSTSVGNAYRRDTCLSLSSQEQLSDKKSSDCGIWEKNDGINGIAVSQEVTRCILKALKYLRFC